jgi:hypothetical protein
MAAATILISDGFLINICLSGIPGAIIGLRGAGHCLRHGYNRFIFSAIWHAIQGEGLIDAICPVRCR